MDYRFDRGLKLCKEEEYESLYPWFIQEIDHSGRPIGSKLIPWQWSFRFKFSSLRYSEEMERGEKLERRFKDEDSESEKSKRYQVKNSIYGQLVSNTTYAFGGNTTFSMFGTDRDIDNISAIFNRLEDEEEEYCYVDGIVSYESEIDFRNEVSPDSLQFYIGLSPSRYDRLKTDIIHDSIDEAYLYISRVEGFYAEYSPSITTDCVKVLTRHCHESVLGNELDISPPQLGETGYNQLTFSKSLSNNLLKAEPKTNFELEHTTELSSFKWQVDQNQRMFRKFYILLWGIIALLTYLLFAKP